MAGGPARELLNYKSENTSTSVAHNSAQENAQPRQDGALMLSQQASLVHLVYSTSSSVSWDLNASVCSWEGVACNDDGFVRSLSLDGKSLSGHLPKEWARLTSLEQISMQGNRLNSSLPKEWSALLNLQYL